MEKDNPYKRLRKRIQSYAEKHPIPTAAENIANFKVLRTLQSDGKVEEASKLRRNIIISNGAFAMKYAIKYCKLINDTNAIEDIFQEAQIGLIEVTDKYNPNLGINFTTYAWFYVKKCIVDYIKNNKIVIAPRDVAKNIKVVTKILDRLYTNTHGCIITAKEIQKELYITEDIYIEERIIDDILLLIDLNSAGSTDTFIMESINDLSGEDTHKEINMLLKSLIVKDINKIQNKELVSIIKMRFGIDYERPFSISEIKMLKSLSEEEIERYKEETRIFLNTNK